MEDEMSDRTKHLPAALALNSRGNSAFPQRAKLIANRVLVGGAVAGVIAAAMILDTTAYADDRPGSQAVLAAQKTSDLMLATLFAALGQEFQETTADNVELGKQSISLIFN